MWSKFEGLYNESLCAVYCNRRLHRSFIHLSDMLKSTCYIFGSLRYASHFTTLIAESGDLNESVSGRC